MRLLAKLQMHCTQRFAKKMKQKKYKIQNIAAAASHKKGWKQIINPSSEF